MGWKKLEDWLPMDAIAASVRRGLGDTVDILMNLWNTAVIVVSFWVADAVVRYFLESGIVVLFFYALSVGMTVALSLFMAWNLLVIVWNRIEKPRAWVLV